MINWKQTLGTSIISAGLVFGTFGPAAFAKSTGENTSDPTVAADPTFEKYQGGPFDIGLVNDDALLKSLTKQGVIDKNGQH
ncbi:hypothetical protein PU629_20470 [Pullulanibacillus sp. KACC 23026]|uniref:hypothetical protein n=1 Tax=Pullulanibacillus sp. KACC 23026 TaxID=3028315 RepID=UPI0023B1D0E1|nr:hypothetical protein [Pullulanibacillus sp. KACC 23026]WEG12443.1 hypothetical protein PU629_20470 [Pullulanibacillus sp. KACC 23026]